MQTYVDRETLDGQIEFIRQSPATSGEVKMIVSRPDIGQRKILEEGELSVESGLQGDNWHSRGSGRKDRDTRYQDMQINIMNVRAIDVIAGGDREKWPLAGDQFFVDFDLSEENLPAGSKLQIGSAIIEVTAEPHLGCQKFRERFGRDAVMFVNSDIGKSIKLRGINAKVVEPGTVSTGSEISKLLSAE